MRKITFITPGVDAANEFRKQAPRLQKLGIEVIVWQDMLQGWNPTDTQVLVTPGNSFGHMTGGFDGAVIERFGDYIQDAVFSDINHFWRGELPVGNALIVGPLRTHPALHIAYAPTMRVPMLLPTDTDAPYVATWAALCVAGSQPIHFERFAITAMGGNTGGVPPAVVAHQMVTAIENYVNPSYVQALFKDGVDRHNKIKQLQLK